MKEIRMVDLIGQLAHIREDIVSEINKVLDSCWFIHGPQVSQFSENLADYLNVAHCIPCANGTDALQIALMALELKPGDEIITTPFTFVSTAETMQLLGLVPVFVDIDPITFNIDVTKIEKAITSKTKAILPVHLFGTATDMGALQEIAKKHTLKIVEDNAQSIGASFNFTDGTSTSLGAIGEIGTISFFPSKNLGAFGDAGAIVTQNSDLAEQISMICKHGSKKKYYHEIVGVNSRLDAIQAAVLNVKLTHLDSYITARRNAASFYKHALDEVEEITLPSALHNQDHVYHQFTLRVSRRDELKAYLKEHNIPSMIYYPVPLHLQKAFAHLGYRIGDLPESESAANQVLSLPMHTELDTEQLEFISNTVKKFYLNS